ncbi:MAG: hypothetical protein ACOZFS_13815 [Thermodesulfobacteriota bacterium]
MAARVFYGSGWNAPLRMGVVVSSLVIMVLAAGCAPTIAPHRPPAYDKAVSLKVESLNLMDKATEPYSQHQAAAQTLRLDLEKAYEDAKGVPSNEVSTQMWEILKNPNGNLLGGFLTLWQKKSVLSKGFITEKKMQVSDAFDKIIALESGKAK